MLFYVDQYQRLSVNKLVCSRLSKTWDANELLALKYRVPTFHIPNPLWDDLQGAMEAGE